MGEVVFAFVIAGMAAGGSMVLTRVIRQWAVTRNRMRRAKIAGVVALIGAVAGMAIAVFGPMDSGIGELFALVCAFQFGVFSWLLWQLIGDAEEVEARRMIANDL